MKQNIGMRDQLEEVWDAAQKSKEGNLIYTMPEITKEDFVKEYLMPEAGPGEDVKANAVIL